MQSTEDSTTTTDDDHPMPKPVLRWLADTMGLNGLCAQANCRRALACRGEPRECLARYAPLVPEEARDGVKAMIDSLMGGDDFDTMRDESEEAIAALEEWTELMQHSRTGWKTRACGK
jgi:hypothetical protein